MNLSLDILNYLVQWLHPNDLCALARTCKPATCIDRWIELKQYTSEDDFIQRGKDKTVIWYLSYQPKIKKSQIDKVLEKSDALFDWCCSQEKILEKWSYELAIHAADKGLFSKVKFIVKAGHLSYEGIGITLQYAAGAGFLEIVQWLHEWGCDHRSEDDRAFREAAENGHLHVVQWLHSKGCDPTAEGNYAICFAARNGHFGMVKWLHERGCDPTAADNFAIKWAAKNGHFEIVQWLYEKGCDLAAKNNYAIRKAVKNNHFEVVKWLHERGCDPAAKNNYAIRWAARNGNLEMVQWLIKRGCDPTADHHWGLQQAIRYNHVEVAKLLFAFFIK